MTTLENANDGIPDDAPQEKLEWVTPKISLMEGGDTEGVKNPNVIEDSQQAGTPGNS
jgi:hypothetical protein